jgi:benzoylformate decarboxylase
LRSCAHGITTIFGNPGSNELPLLQDFPDDFRYILALQEGAAIEMPDGFAQATGRPSLVNLHAAAGTGNAMGNLINTQSGHVPVIITSGQQARRYTALDAYLWLCSDRGHSRPGQERQWRNGNH